jgi:hypothetical protein
MDDIALPKKKTRKVGAVLPGDPGDKGHPARGSACHHATRHTAVRSTMGRCLWDPMAEMVSSSDA